MSNHSPPTPLEACRIAPYVNVPALRNATPATTSTSTGGGSFPPGGFTPFDPALISAAAHQVQSIVLRRKIY